MAYDLDIIVAVMTEGWWPGFALIPSMGVRTAGRRKASTDALSWVLTTSLKRGVVPEVKVL